MTGFELLISGVRDDLSTAGPQPLQLYWEPSIYIQMEMSYQNEVE